MRWIAFLLVSICSLFACVGAGAQRSLTLGRPSFESPLADVSEQVVQIAFERTGLALQVMRLPVLRSIEMANDGEIDGDLLRIAEVGQRYANLVAVPTAVARLDLAIYGRSPDIGRLPREEIRRLRVGITRGTFTAIKHSQGMTVEEGPDARNLFDRLVDAQFDAAMLVYVDAEYELRQNGSAGIYRWPYCWASEPQYLHLNRRHADLVAPLNSALQQMQRDGLIDQIYANSLRKLNIEPLLKSAECGPKGSRR